LNPENPITQGMKKMIPDKVLIAHLDTVDGLVNALAPRAQVGFVASCASRQRNAFVRAATGRDELVGSAEAFDAVLEKMWGIAISDQLAELDGAVPISERLFPEGLEASGPLMAVVQTVGNAVKDFVSIAAGGDVAYARYTAARNVELVEIIADEVTFDCEPLMRAEMERQLADLATLQAASGPQDFSALRARNAGLSVYGELWFQSS
jgi:hypothetical protein